ncbi:MAG: helix-turn-helix domain-containing protein [Bacteroides sp.]|nr:helix-turn-helix domain-containing protein [Eubacterium sp.]MCM1419431.1 helix-turn-helix domain-containing protein [Roseburia sp.]MCM1462982.1 helix-turn-helix domain-containing protein [Bacteroides sp.]
MELAAMIKKARKDLNLTQKDLADKVGTNQSYVSQLENGYISPSLSHAMAIAKELHIKLDDLNL